MIGNGISVPDPLQQFNNIKADYIENINSGKYMLGTFK